MNALCVGGTFAGRTSSTLLSCTPLTVVASVSPVSATEASHAVVSMLPSSV